MKTQLKYIALLLVSGVIIPLCSHCFRTATPTFTIPTTKQVVDTPIKRDGLFHFYFVNDAAEKLLPVLTFFK
jgi:hypothetical protein